MDHSLRVISFWDWFKSISDNLASNISNTNLLEQLDNQIKLLGPFDWEIGPLENDYLYLSISPNLNEELLVTTRQIISLAPTCEGWFFFPAKPPKEWADSWKMLTDSGTEFIVDASKWKYVLYKFEDHTFDIDIFINAASKDLYKLAAEIAITNIIGEERFIELIQNVTVVEVLNQELEGKSSYLKYLYNHIVEITNKPDQRPGLLYN
jgi:hypothetical protein